MQISYSATLAGTVKFAQMFLADLKPTKTMKDGKIGWNTANVSARFSAPRELTRNGVYFAIISAGTESHKELPFAFGDLVVRLRSISRSHRANANRGKDRENLVKRRGKANSAVARERYCVRNLSTRVYIRVISLMRNTRWRILRRGLIRDVARLMRTTEPGPRSFNLLITREQLIF